jgi:hypothetical protein
MAVSHKRSEIGDGRGDIIERIGRFTNFIDGKSLSALKTSRKETHQRQKPTLAIGLQKHFRSQPMEKEEYRSSRVIETLSIRQPAPEKESIVE